MNDHPGGADLLLETAGSDATAAFEDTGHSDDAREILNSFLVGQLAGANLESNVPETTVRVIHKATDNKVAVEQKPIANPKYFAFLTVGISVILAVRFAFRKEDLPHNLSTNLGSRTGANNFRSEERRVGKECA